MEISVHRRFQAPGSRLEFCLSLRSYSGPCNAGQKCVATALKICSFSGLRMQLSFTSGPWRSCGHGFVDNTRDSRLQAKGRRCYLSQNIDLAVAGSADLLRRPCSMPHSLNQALPTNTSSYLQCFCMHARTHPFAHQQRVTITIATTFERKNAVRRKETAFEELLPTFWIRLATSLHFVHDIAVPISRSHQRSCMMRPGIGRSASCAVGDSA